MDRWEDVEVWRAGIIKEARRTWRAQDRRAENATAPLYIDVDDSAYRRTGSTSFLQSKSSR